MSFFRNLAKLFNLWITAGVVCMVIGYLEIAPCGAAPTTFWGRLTTARRAQVPLSSVGFYVESRGDRVKETCGPLDPGIYRVAPDESIRTVKCGGMMSFSTRFPRGSHPFDPLPPDVELGFLTINGEFYLECDDAYKLRRAVEMSPATDRAAVDSDAAFGAIYGIDVGAAVNWALRDCYEAKTPYESTECRARLAGALVGLSSAPEAPYLLQTVELTAMTSAK